MILSTRIAVMEQGRFEQIGTPKQVYEYPRNRFVADFIGTINMFEGKVLEQSAGQLLVESAAVRTTLTAQTDDQYATHADVCIAVRPEKIFISQHEPDNDEDTRLAGIVEDFGYFGNLSLYRIRLASGKIVQVSAQNRRRSMERQLEWDDQVFISWHPRSAVVLDR